MRITIGILVPRVEDGGVNDIRNSIRGDSRRAFVVLDNDLGEDSHGTVLDVRHDRVL